MTTRAGEVSAVVGVYTWFVGALTVGLSAAVWMLGPPSATVSAAIMVAAVALIGLPHGAYDVEVARRMLSRPLGRWWWALFGGAYVALAVLGLGLWVLLPASGLILLLIGGAAHWGVDDLEVEPRRRFQMAWLAISRGAVPVAAPMAFHAEASADIFSTLLGASAIPPDAVRAAGVAWLIAGGPGIVASAVWARAAGTPARVRAVAEPLVLLAWFASAPPILAFTIYFCLWHSVRHSLRSALSARPGERVAVALAAYTRAAFWPTALTWLLAGTAAVVWLTDLETTEASSRLVFIGLFALTVPHVLLDLLEHRKAVRG
ncbi:MAG: Brp/Blh family beta-carotene 15,15'-dioxygenase [Planctomycetota bacterium]